MGYIAFGKGENSNQNWSKTAEFGYFGPVVIEFPQESASDHGCANG
jgi:hypothetical protein